MKIGNDFCKQFNSSDYVDFCFNRVIFHIKLMAAIIVTETFHYSFIETDFE